MRVRAPFLGVRQLVVGVVIALTGCATILPGQYSEQTLQTYRLAPELADQAAAIATGLVLFVAPPRAGAGFNSTRIAYTQRPFELSYYAHHEWVDSPAQMLGPLLVTALENSGHYRAVLNQPSSGLADLRLDTELLGLWHEFQTLPSQGKVIVRVQLIDLAARRVLGTRTIQAAADAPEDNPVGGVAALNLALHKALLEVVKFCTEQLR
jgi:cholesterol transport system auxiliary component